MATAPDTSGAAVMEGPRDIPALPQDRKTIEPVVRAPLEAMRASVQTLLGFRGDPLDTALTLRKARELGIINTLGQFSVDGAVGTVGGTGGTGGTTAPDLTPPPSVTGLAAAPGFANIFVSWDAPTYTVGHGHQATRLFVAKRLPTDPPATFADAVLYEEETGGLTIAALASDLSIRWHIWAKYVTNDGVESVSPAGGVNGVIAQTGLVGTSDLGAAIVLAGNLAPGSVTADKAALEIGGDNLLANSSFEQDTDGDGLADQWGGYNNTPTPEPATWSRTPGRIAGLAQRVTWTGTNTSSKGVVNGLPARTNGFGPLKTYVVSFYARASVAQASGCGIAFNTNPVTSVQLKNPNLTTAWQRYAWRITWGALVDPSIYFTILYGGGQAAGWVEFDDAQVEEGDTLTGYTGKLALNTIVAGDGAIGNLAITHALVGTLAVDDANIAALNAIKLTVGTGEIGGNLKSTIFTPGSAGWIIRPDGSAEFGFTHIRGTLTAGQIAANYIATAMLQAGAVTATKISVTNLAAINADMGTITAGTLTAGTVFAGALSAATGTFAGALSAATGSFAGSLSAATGTFAGSLSAASGTFAGTLTAAALVLAGQSLFLPQFASGSGVTSNSTTYATALTSGSINPGATGTVLVIVTFHYTMGTTPGSESDPSSFAVPTFRIQCNGGSIAGGSWSAPAGGNTPFTGAESRAVRHVPGGAAVYTLQISGDTSVTASTIGTCTMIVMGVLQ